MRKPGFTMTAHSQGQAENNTEECQLVCWDVWVNTNTVTAPTGLRQDKINMDMIIMI